MTIPLIVFFSVVFLLVLFIVINVWSPRKRIDHHLTSLYGPKDPQFIRTMGCLMGPALLDGNRITPLQNGVEIFPAMLEAIRCAKITITFETYIYWSGAIGKEFAEALAERARAGVRVHVLLDWQGSRTLDQESITQMESAGVNVEIFHPLRWYNLARLNNRTHRKILVIDGCIGFTGGVGIADTWTGNADSPEHWRDSHYRIEGPIVAQLQAAFLDNWHTNNPDVLHSERYFPQLEPVGHTLGQVFKSSPEEGSGSVRLMYMLSIAAAKETLQLAMAYFVPDRLALQMLTDARERGVRIQIIVPGSKTDYPVTRRASRAKWGKLLKAGIEIYEYQPTMYHCKYMIVDGVWMSVGSTNFDNRSFRLNREANLNVFDEEFAASQKKVFEDDLKHSRQITFSEWKRRPLNERIAENLALLIESQL